MKYYLICFLTLFTFLLCSPQISAQENSIGDFIQAGNYQKAIDIILMKGNVENLQDADLESLGYCYVMTREYDKAESVYSKLVSNKKSTVENIRYYAEILFINKKYDLAREKFVQCLESKPTDNFIQIKIASCDSLKLWQNKNNRYLISNFSGINTAADEMCALSTTNNLLYLSNRKNEVTAKDPINYNILAPFTVKNYDVSTFNVLGSVSEDKYISVSNKSYISEKYWCSAIAYCKERNLNAYALKTIHKSMQDFSLDNSVIMFDNPENNSIDDLILFKWAGMPENINVSQPGFAKNGKRLYFSSDMPGGQGGMDLYYSDLVNDVWSKPVNLGENVNTAFDEISPVISGDTILFFSSNGLPGYGNFDVYNCKISTNSFGKSVNMKFPINSTGDDFYYNPNYGENSLLTSNRSSMGKGGYDIYVINLPTIVIPKDTVVKLPIAQRVLDIKNYKLPFVLFDLNNSDLDKNYEQSLKNLADTLKLFNDVKLDILGYTDVLGNNEQNLELSAARAKSVAEKLISYGVSSSQLSYKGMGIAEIKEIEDIKITVILGTITSPNEAEWFNKMLNNKSEVMVMPNGKYFSYCVGDFDNLQDAEKLANELKSSYFSNSYVGYFYFGKCLPKYSASINRRVDLILSKSVK